jgi:hypothetical protein
MDVTDLAWRKSARSGEQGNCVEIAVTEQDAE